MFNKYLFLKECFGCKYEFMCFNRKYDQPQTYEAVCLRNSCEISNEIYKTNVFKTEIERFENYKDDIE